MALDRKAASSFRRTAQLSLKKGIMFQSIGIRRTLHLAY
jgi:hypothetical protein